MARTSATARNSKRRRQTGRRLALQPLTSRRLMAADLAIAQPQVETVPADSFEFALVEPFASSQDVNTNDMAIQQIAGDGVASPDYFYDLLSRQVRSEVSEDTGLSGVSRYEYDGLSNLTADPLQDIKDLYDSNNNDPNNGQANSADDAVGVTDDASSDLPYQYDSNRNVVRPTPGNDQYDDIVIRYPYDSDSIGEVYTFYAPGEANADNDNEQNANDSEPLLGPGRGGLLGPGGVVDQNGRKANRDQGRSDRFDANDGPALRSEVNDDELDALAARFQQLLESAFRGEQSDLASFGDPNALTLGYFHGRLLPALPFVGLFSGGTGQSPWIRRQPTPSQESLPEVLRNNPLAAVLLRYKLGDYGLEDLSQADFDAYTRGLQRGYRDALKSLMPE